jgi:hypothetical protein
MFDQIEKLKQEFTDKYVVVDRTIPELARFEGHVGQVKTVNMNGRALVEFDAWSNIGWYDIELDYLKVVPKPDKAAEEKHAAPARPAAKPAAEAKPAAAEGKKLSPLEMARMQGAAKPAGEKPAAAAGAKKSTADILAAARAAKSGGTAEAKPSAKPAAPAAPKPAAPAGGKMSTADILAAARAKKAAAEPAASAPAAEAPASDTPVAEAPEPAATSEVKTAPPKAAAASKPIITAGQRPTVAEILAWCREHDTK